MTAVIFHSPFHALGSRRKTASSHRTADSFLFGHEVRVAAPSIRIVPWAALASCWPLPQQQLSVSAAGGGRCCCKPFHRPPYCPAGNRVPPQPYAEFSVDVEPNNEFYGRILQMGAGLEVVSPESVRNEIAQRVHNLADLYPKKE